MALTYTPRTDQINQKAPNIIGDLKLWIGTVTFDNSYPTGGEVILPTDVGFNVSIDAVIAMGSPGGSRLFLWDQANKKMKLFTALGTEAVNASDQSTITFPIMVIGR